MESIDKSTCALKHKEVDDRLGTHERRLNAHSEKIDRLSEESTSFKVELKHLCNNIKTLTTTLWWFIGIVIGGMSAFFFAAIQEKVIK